MSKKSEESKPQPQPSSNSDGPPGEDNPPTQPAKLVPPGPPPGAPPGLPPGVPPGKYMYASPRGSSRVTSRGTSGYICFHLKCHLSRHLSIQSTFRKFCSHVSDHLSVYYLSSFTWAEVHYRYLCFHIFSFVSEMDFHIIWQEASTQLSSTKFLIFYTPHLLGRIMIWRGRLSVCPSVHKACKHNTNWTVSARTIKLGTHTSYDKRSNPIDFQGQRSRSHTRHYCLTL